MKKKGFIVRLAVLAVVLCLVTMSLTAGTLAKYASETSGNATATVAKWSVALKKDGTEVTGPNSITLDLHDADQEAANLVEANKVAPGTKGSFALEVDGSGTEVAFAYTIELDMSNTALATAPIKFYSNSDRTTEIALDSDKKLVLTDNVLTNAEDAAKKATQTVYWKWDSTAYDAETNEDNRDTKVGEASAAVEGGGGLVYTIPVTLKAEQLITAPGAGA